jgi:hypothetical protein
MVELDTIFLLPILFIIGVALLFYSYTTFRDYQLIRDTATSKVQSLSVGTAEVKGKAKPIKKDGEKVAYRHPLTRDPVLYYDLVIQEHRENDDGSDWHTVKSDEVGKRFFVDDGTGKVEVKVENPRFEFADEDRTREKYVVGPDKDVPEVLEQYQDDSFLPDILDRERYRVKVKSIKPNQDLFIFGSAQIKSDEEGSSTNEENLIIRNPGDDSGGAFDKDKPQIISTESEEELQSGMKWVIPASFLGGLALCAISLYFMLNIFIF